MIEIYVISKLLAEQVSHPGAGKVILAGHSHHPVEMLLS